MELRIEWPGGVDTELTPSAARGRWSSADNVRFREGKPEKIRGRARISGLMTITGVCRALHWWVDLSGVPRYGVGTSSHLQLWQNGVIYDITPAGLPPGLISSVITAYTLRIWSLDNFGQDLLCVPSGFTVYVWQPPNTAAPAVPVPNAPPHNQGGFMTMPQQIFMVYGSAPNGGAQDPMLIRWSDQSDYTVWDPTTTNFAGSFRISRGSRLVGGVQTPLGAFIWSDLDVWAVTYEGQPLVFGFFQLASNCGLLAQKAFSVAGNVPYWLSDHGIFKASGGGVTQVDCPVWDFLFLDLDEQNQDKCLCEINYLFNEIYFRFPSKSGGTGEIDSYIKMNLLDERIWDTGREVITASTDQNRPGSPVNISLDGFLSEVDTTLDNDGKVINAFVQSGFSDIEDGTKLMFVERFSPDFIWEGHGPTGSGPQADITLFFRRFAADPPTAVGPFTITPQTEYVTLASPHPTEPGIMVRPRGREWAIRIAWNTLDSWSRWGAPRILTSEDGRWG